MRPLPIIPANDEALMTKIRARIDMRSRNSSFRIPSSFVIRASSLLATCVFFFAAAAEGQIQVDLKFTRMQYLAYEPVVVTLAITNLAGRDIELHDTNGQSWLGFEVTGNDDQPTALLSTENAQPPLKIEAGQRVTRQIDLASLYPVHDFGAYHVRTHVYFADLAKFFYSSTRVFEVTDARPLWQQTVGIPDGVAANGAVRTYSLLTNRFPDHTSLYVRVQDKDTGIVYATYSLGRTITFEQPQAEIDRANQLHVLHCAAPRAWSYSRIGLNGELLTHSSFMETKSRPRLVHAANGEVAVRGGVAEAPAQGSRSTAPKLSARPPGLPKDDH
ncbi:MAG: hypothetical protein DME31_00425 [Verrucomicrobia bacterium]|nr:MAG: hypothetical protein DME31_00425 [Verrucomicrobiota bacterium]PYL31469.1 MAG: hypothetical protein DMF39_02770 [Verrucomicrobiota bacterium]